MTLVSVSVSCKLGGVAILIRPLGNNSMVVLVRTETARQASTLSAEGPLPI